MRLACCGTPLVAGRQVTGFSNTEEAVVQLTEVVPFLVEDELVDLGARYSKAEDWHAYVVNDGLLITGQNPASSERAARAMLTALDNGRGADAPTWRHAPARGACAARAFFFTRHALTRHFAAL